MKKNEISAKFNDILTKAISEGFFPCMTELTGSYSNVMGSQIVLAKGNERIVLWMEENEVYLSSGNEPFSVTLYASRFTLNDGESVERSHYWSTQWKEHIVWSETVYRVSDRGWHGEGWYSNSEKEAREAEAVRFSRWEHKSVSCTKEYEVTDRLMSIVRKVKGFKTVARKNVRVSKCRNVWYIENVASGNRVTLSA